MTITMQGTWTVAVKSKSAAFPQRFVIQGSDSSDGHYDGIVGSPPVQVTGAQWTLTIQHNPTGPIGWTPSAERLEWPSLSGGQIKFDILSNDTGPDQDYNDLILTCSTTANDSEYVLYGTARTYAGLCLFNPCFEFPWAVIDTPIALKQLLGYPSVGAALEKLYPEQVRRIRRPIPEPDPPPFRPLMIPLSATESEAPQPSRARKALRFEGKAERAASAGFEPRATRATLGGGAFTEVQPYISDIAKLIDRFRFQCDVEYQAGLLLRFEEYDRTTAELAGGPYTGTGNREILGLTVTDEQGRYIFRYTQTLADIAREFGDVPAGGVLATELRPDIIVQVISGGATSSVLFETGLYANVQNLQRIDLCFPESELNPGLTACQGGRAIQAIGNIFTLAGVGNTLDAAGRITATHPSGPQITRGAWVGGLDLFACFLDHPDVRWYTVRFRKPGGGWSFVQETYTHIFIPFIGDPSNPAHKVGPFNESLAVDGGAPQLVPAYKNIESDSQWVATHRLRKVILSSGLYAGLLYTLGAGSVDFCIEGYNAGGNKVAGADDTVTLFIDNRAIFGNIDSISLGGVAPGECGLFDLPSPGAALAMRFKVEHPGGFLQEYDLDVLRGHATPVAVADLSPTPQPLGLTYVEATYGDNFFGTFNAVAPDGDGYVVAQLQPTSGAWLPAGKNFCAFAFEINGTPRTTDGYNLGSRYRLDVQLIGISYNPPPGP